MCAREFKRTNSPPMSEPAIPRSRFMSVPEVLARGPIGKTSLYELAHAHKDLAL
jgi:hypothetical protein